MKNICVNSIVFFLCLLFSHQELIAQSCLVGGADLKVAIAGLPVTIDGSGCSSPDEGINYLPFFTWSGVFSNDTDGNISDASITFISNGTPRNITLFQDIDGGSGGPPGTEPQFQAQSFPKQQIGSFALGQFQVSVSSSGSYIPNKTFSVSHNAGSYAAVHSVTWLYSTTLDGTYAIYANGTSFSPTQNGYYKARVKMTKNNVESNSYTTSSVYASSPPPPPIACIQILSGPSVAIPGIPINIRHNANESNNDCGVNFEHVPNTGAWFKTVSMSGSNDVQLGDEIIFIEQGGNYRVKILEVDNSNPLEPLHYFRTIDNIEIENHDTYIAGIKSGPDQGIDTQLELSTKAGVYITNIEWYANDVLQPGNSTTITANSEGEWKAKVFFEHNLQTSEFTTNSIFVTAACLEVMNGMTVAIPGMSIELKGNILCSFDEDAMSFIYAAPGVDFQLGAPDLDQIVTFEANHGTYEVHSQSIQPNGQEGDFDVDSRIVGSIYLPALEKGLLINGERYVQSSGSVVEVGSELGVYTNADEYIDHIEWYQNGALVSNGDTFIPDEVGKYYANIVFQVEGQEEGVKTPQILVNPEGDAYCVQAIAGPGISIPGITTTFSEQCGQIIAKWDGPGYRMNGTTITDQVPGYYTAYDDNGEMVGYRRMKRMIYNILADGDSISELSDPGSKVPFVNSTFIDAESEFSNGRIDQLCISTNAEANVNVSEIQWMRNGRTLDVPASKCLNNVQIPGDYTLKLAMISGEQSSTIDINIDIQVVGGPELSIDYNASGGLVQEAHLNIDLKSLNYNSLNWYKNGVLVEEGISSLLKIEEPGYYVVGVQKVNGVEVFSNELLVEFPTVNMITTLKAKKEGFKTFENFSNAPLAEVSKSMTYFDGLGRVIQEVQQGASPSQNDMIVAHAYDDYGRELKKYLPFESDFSTGQFIIDPTVKLTQFYATGANGIAQTTVPFSETMTEAYMGGRPLEVGASGEAWQLGTGHTTRMEYALNTAIDGVIRYGIDSGGDLLNHGLYAQADLLVTKTTDNTSISIEFYDLRGRKVLQRQLLDGEKLDTYYVYSEADQLVFVLPPKLN